jgi:uncharacterized protein YbjQ (UPF0145 family)
MRYFELKSHFVPLGYERQYNKGKQLSFSLAANDYLALIGYKNTITPIAGIVNVPGFNKVIVLCRIDRNGNAKWNPATRTYERKEGTRFAHGNTVTRHQPERYFDNNGKLGRAEDKRILWYRPWYHRSTANSRSRTKGRTERYSRGEMSPFITMCETARQQALDIMVQRAEAVGANAVVGVRYDSSAFGESDDMGTEVVCYGTAVILESKDGATKTANLPNFR